MLLSWQSCTRSGASSYEAGEHLLHPAWCLSVLPEHRSAFKGACLYYLVSIICLPPSKFLSCIKDLNSPYQARKTDRVNYVLSHWGLGCIPVVLMTLVMHLYKCYPGLLMAVTLGVATWSGPLHQVLCIASLVTGAPVLGHAYHNSPPYAIAQVVSLHDSKQQHA